VDEVGYDDDLNGEEGWGDTVHVVVEAETHARALSHSRTRREFHPRIRPPVLPIILTRQEKKLTSLQQLSTEVLNLQSG